MNDLTLVSVADSGFIVIELLAQIALLRSSYFNLSDPYLLRPKF